MKLIFLAVLSVAISACSYNVRQSESVDQKIARFQPEQNNPNSVPEIDIISFSVDQNLSLNVTPIEQKQIGRKPASLELSSGPANPPISIKRMYFSTLFEQYLELIKYSSNPAPTLKHCPSFHTSFIPLQSAPPTKTPMMPESIEKAATLAGPEMMAIYPELSLPATIDSIYPKIGDLIVKKTRVEEKIALIKNGIDTHIQKNFQELSELCQTGSSSNYYSFENLITFMNNSPKMKPDSESLQMLLKTTLFTNALVIRSLNNFDHQMERSPSSLPSNKLTFIEQTKMDWIHRYFETIKQKRSVH